MASPALPRGLYALCDDGLVPEWPLEEKAQALLAAGVRVIQLRMKRTPAERALAAARAIAAQCHEAGAVLIVNDRVDLALLSGADGVHLGADDLPVAEARRLLGPDKLVGATCRSLEHLRAAHAAGADHAGVGPVFRTGSKQVNAAELGLARLAEICAGSPLPVVAIAGIGEENIEQVAAAGAHGAAVLSALLVRQDLADRARRLAAGFERGSAGRRFEPR